MNQPKALAPTPKEVGPPKTSTFVLIGLAVLLVASIGFNIWLFMQKTQVEADAKRLGDEKAALQANSSEGSSTSNAAPCNDTPTVAMKDNIKAALDTQNTAVFSTYTSNPVNYVLAASELGKDMTPDEAALALDYTHSATGPWDFNLPTATTDAYRAGFYTEHFATSRYVGKAASGMVVSFGFDCNGKINKIFVAADTDLL